MFQELELRKLPIGTLCSITNILETDDAWKKFMCYIPKNPTSDKFEPKYNNEHIRLIEDESKIVSRQCADILFDEWGTSGRIRPTLSTLKQVALRAGIWRVADEVASLLKEPPPTRPNYGPEALVNTNVSVLLNDESMEQRLNAMDSIKKKDFYNFNKQTDQAFGNRTTLQLKSASDFIKFSTSIASTDIPNISGLQSANNKSTAKVQTNDLIKFSDKQPDLQTLQSLNVPDFSAIMTETPDDSETSSNIPVIVQTDSDTSSEQITQKNSMRDNQISFSQLNFESASSGIESIILHDTNLIHFKYKELENITQMWSGKIGSGGFGEVFVGFHPIYEWLAIKKAHINLPTDRKPDIGIKVFNAEVKYLSQFRHKNIVPILGFSRDGPALCIVCEYIDGGSLQQKLAARVLTEKQRIDIMLGTAEGLKYLHRSERQSDDPRFRTSLSDSQNSSKKNNFVHGDVKSANILLTKDCIPKLCDFGLAQQFDTTFIMTSPMGTQAYMAPEGFQGTITQKNDIYSYGIVLLELLTGLRPIVVSNSEKTNIKMYVEENCPNNDITNILDPVVEKWIKAEELYQLSKRCLKYDRKMRPSIDDVCDTLYKISGERL